MEINYTEHGFKCGIEVHQQIEEVKLFCRCPTQKREGSPDYKIKRHLRSAAGETGEVDVAAKYESEKKKYFLYEGHNATTCIVELDECPPFPVNETALDIALKVALLFNATIVDEIQFMRKTVVDGSNTSGFQRTALIAVDGAIETEKGRVGIPTICLEEEAAQKITSTDNYVEYNLDRLGIALLEIATDASIKDPQHAKEVAAYVGMVLRSVDGVKRGLGTIRQDVNVSINGGARTEIKGFQDLRSIPKVIDYEVGRQIRNSKHGKKVKEEVRKAEPDFTTSFLRPMPGAARMYVETDVQSIRIDKKRLATLKKELPQLLADKAQELEKKYTLSSAVAHEVVTKNIDFHAYVKKFKIPPAFIARVLVEMPKEIKARFKIDPSQLVRKDFEEVLRYYEKKDIPKDSVFELLVEKAKGNTIDLSAFKGVSDSALKKEIEAIVKQKPGLNVGAYMGIIMGKHRGKVDGKKVMELLKEMVSGK